MFTPIKSKRIIQKTPKSSVRLSPPIPKKEQKSDSNNNSSVVQNIHKIQERSKVFYNSEKFKVISRQKGPLNFNLTDEINLDANFTLHQNFMTISTQSSFIVFNWKLNEYLNSFDIEDKQLSVLFDNGELLLFSSNVFKYIKNIAYNNDSTITFYVTLEQHEFGIKLLNFNPIGYILVTNFGNVFKIVLNERKEFKVVKFSKDLSSFGLNSLVNSVSSFLTYLPQEKNDLGILNVISGEINGKSRQLLILLKEEIQIWSVSKSHEQMSYRIKLKDLILEKELTIFNLERTSIEFLAFDFNESERKIVVLISVDKKKLHQLSFNPNIENFKVDHIQLQTFLNYNKTLNQERIELFNVQGTSFIFFSQALLVLNNSKLSPSSQELICFNENIICHYVDKSKLTRGQDNTENCLIYFQKSGVVSIDAIIKNFVSYDRKVALYKQIEQAVFYGNQVDENPIDFVIFPQEDDLNMSCVELVDNILNGKSVYIQDDFEIKNYIFEQENIFKNLVDYLNALGIYNQIGEKTRFSLMYKMEKLRSMMALWQYMDSCLNRNRGEDAILRSAIETFYEKTEFKKFFKYNTLCIEKLLENIDFPSANGISKKGFELYQCNKVLLLIVDTAVTFRMNAGLLFGLENLDVKTFGMFKTNFGYTEPWTAKDKILQFLESQFDSTTKFLETQDIDMDVDEEYNGGSDRENFKKQLYRLGDVLLDCFFQKCSITQLREKRLEQRLHTLANKILLNIFKVNKEFAFFLGSKYCCYELLVRLSLKLEPAEVNSKLAFFLKKFEYEFAKQLFEYRLREGSFHKIFDEKEAPTAFKDYDKFLGIFLMEKQGSLNIFSWIQEIKLKNYHAAAEILSGIADTELDFSKKRVANSLSFLALVADENTENFTSKEKLPPSLELRYWDNIKSQDYSELQFLVLNSLKERALLKKPNAVTAEDLIEANFKKFMEDKPGYKLLTLKALETCISNHHVDELLLFNIFLSRSENDGDIEFSAKLFMEFTLFLLERSQKELVFGYEVHTKYEFLWKMLWRRAYLFTDWQQFTKLSKMASSDQSFIQGKQRTMVNTLFQTISNYQNLETEQKRLYIFEPNEHVSFSEKSLRLFKSFLKNSNFTKKQEEKIIQDFTKENENMKVVNDLQGAKLLFNSYLRESGLSEK